MSKPVIDFVWQVNNVNNINTKKNYKFFEKFLIKIFTEFNNIIIEMEHKYSSEIRFLFYI